MFTIQNKIAYRLLIFYFTLFIFYLLYLDSGFFNLTAVHLA